MADAKDLALIKPEELSLVEIPHLRSGKYYATRNGDIYSATRGVTLKKLRVEKLSGYHRVKVGGEKIFVHRLVAYTFIGLPLFDSMVVNHKNGIKIDNRVENLEWVSYGENLLHSYNSLNRKLPNTKLSDSDVLEIRAKSTGGVSQKELCENYKVNHSTISEVVNFKRYKNVTDGKHRSL